jgi:hypothetical protein
MKRHAKTSQQIRPALLHAPHNIGPKELNRNARTAQPAFQYLIAIGLPITLAEVWPGPEMTKPVAACTFFLCIAIFARFFGFRQALACTLASAITLWSLVRVEPLESRHMPPVKLLLCIVASVVLASVSRQRSKEVREAEERLHALFETAIDAIGFTLPGRG